MIARIKAVITFFRVPENSQFGHCECWPCCGNCEKEPTSTVSVNTAPITILDRRSLQAQRDGLLGPS